MKYLLLLLTLCSCASNELIERNEPDFKPKLYSASWIEGALVRRQENEVISCTDKKFQEFACMSYKDLIKLQQVLGACLRFSDVEFEE